MNTNNLDTISLSYDEVKDILNQIKNVRVGVIGDGCLDIYWHADMTLSELSRETPHYPLPVVREHLYLGAGANVAANLKSLGAKYVTILTVIGNDWRGREFLNILKTLDICEENILCSDERITPAYCKPLRKGISEVVYEDPRLDFENFIPLLETDENLVVEQLRAMAAQVDIIAVCDQFRSGIITKKVHQELEALSKKGKLVVVDSRNNIRLYEDVIVKPNELECLRAFEDFPLQDIKDDDVFTAAIKLEAKTRKPVVVTRGDKGALWVEKGDITLAPSIPASPPIDLVGAGDAFMSAFCCAYSAGVPGAKAIAFANYASAVVVKKIGMAGTANPEEILLRFKELNKDR